jgi:beta-lactam-binding protein with PASTA domain
MKLFRKGSGPRDSESRLLRLIFFFALGTIVLAAVAGLITFLLTLEGSEETMVPDVQGMELANAIIELQDKGLYAGVQLRYSQKLSEKGTVIGQEPTPGSIVNAKSRVSLKVSKGAAVEKLDNYVGWKVEELEAHLKSLESVYGPLLKLKKPYIRVYDEAPAGTILEQKPKSGTELTVLTELELVVSKGPEGQTAEVSEYAGMEWRQAFREIISEGHPFIFTLTDSEEGDPGTIVSQSPAAGKEVDSTTLRQLLVRPPEEIEEGHRFGILERELPEYQVSVPITVHAILPNGEEEDMISFSHKGGVLTIPYLQEEGSTIVVSIGDREEIRYEVPENEGVQ